MKRRHALLGSLGVAASRPTVALAQRRPGRPSLGWLNAGTQQGSAAFIAPFLAGMAELGYVDGRTIDYNFKFADGYVERLAPLADELIAAQPSILVGGAVIGAVVLRQKTTTIPIICPVMPNAVGLGLAESLARPGKNVTGVANFVDRLPSKQLELALEVVPRARTIGLLGNLSDDSVPAQVEEIERLAQAKGLTIRRPEILRPEDVLKAIQRLVADSCDIVIVLQTSMVFAQRWAVAETLNKAKVPAMYGYREHVLAGGLMSYGVDLRWCSHRSATMVHKVLSGIPPGEIPIEFPTKLDLIVNTRVAQDLGLEFPTSILLRADETID